MKYSYNQNKDGVVFANAKDLNASFKDLGAVCAQIRYMPVPLALDLLGKVGSYEMPIEYRKHNKHMGSRHELGGKKGRWPGKCARIVLKALNNAAANAKNKGLDPDQMYVVHAAANKTFIAMRYPPKGTLFPIKGLMGYTPARRSDLEFSRVELGISELDEKRLGKSLSGHIKYTLKKLPKRMVVKKEEKKEEKKARKPIVQKVHPEMSERNVPQIQEAVPPAQAPAAQKPEKAEQKEKENEKVKQ
jgi:large subunit ribosomal protein L22